MQKSTYRIKFIVYQLITVPIFIYLKMHEAQIDRSGPVVLVFSIWMVAMYFMFKVRCENCSTCFADLFMKPGMQTKSFAEMVGTIRFGYAKHCPECDMKRY